MSQNEKGQAKIAIPMGDPAGVGPEITVKALSRKDVFEEGKPFVVGDKKVLEKAVELTGVPLKINAVNSPEEAGFTFGTADVVDLHNVDITDLEFGEVQAQCGKAAYEYIQQAVEYAQNGKADVVATTPINKESLKAAEVPFIGHTEMLASMADIEDPLTMFEVRSLRIFFLTRHVSLKEAIGQITEERVHDYLLRCDKALGKLGVAKRRFAVAGLNPHSGEKGLFGNEEGDRIVPGIERAVQDGIDVEGPVPADSVFHQALNGKYDAVLSLYHDQGHIAAKMTDFERTVSITNGLPFLRTSVDHGTAFDIAGTGEASSVSMEECIRVAAKYAPHFAVKV